jgi:hypothetical protein
MPGASRVARPDTSARQLGERPRLARLDGRDLPRRPDPCRRRLGPWRAIERSTALLRKTWGENLIGNAGISLVMSMISVTVGLMGVGGGMLLFRLGRRLLGTALLSATDHKPLADSLGCRRAVGDLRRGRLPLRRRGDAAGGLRRRPDPRRLHAQGHIIGACGHEKHAKR